MLKMSHTLPLKDKDEGKCTNDWTTNNEDKVFFKLYKCICVLN